MDDVLIVSAVRLPIGRFGGALKEVSDWDLGTIVIAEAIKRAGLKGDEIDEVIMAHGFRTGDLPANSSRAVALRAGIPIETPQFTINKACGGSLRAVSLAAQIIKAGESDIIVAGGLESMSRAAFLLTKARWGIDLDMFGSLTNSSSSILFLGIHWERQGKMWQSSITFHVKIRIGLLF